MSGDFNYGIPRPLEPRKSQFPTTTQEKKFLREPVPELETADQWKGVKIVGAGGFAIVGLWKYVGKDLTITNPEYVAVKQENLITAAKEGNMNAFNNEAKWHRLLNQANSQHIMRIVRERQPFWRKFLGQESLVVERVLLEYCPLGTLKELLEGRIGLAKPFPETVLWTFFDCLVDGLCVLAYGNEPSYDTVSGKADVVTREDWDEIHHGDLNTRNILLGSRNATHPFTPVIKLADFGEASALKNAHENNIQNAGKIIAALATLHAKVDSVKMVSHQDDIDGWRPKGSTLACEGLRYTPYSLPLRQIIFECVYQDAKFRPSLLQLKERAQEGLRIAVEAVPEGEPWEDFVHPGPEPPEWDDEGVMTSLMDLTGKKKPD